MPKTLAAEPSLNPALLAFKPRQLLISRSDMSILPSQHKTLLLRSIAQYLKRCGFSKSFKKLVSEAEIEEEVNPNLPSLEEMCLDYFKNTCDQKEFASDGITEVNAVEEGVENVKKEKKNKKKKKETKVEVAEEEKVKETDAEIENGLKEKKKKKKMETKVEVADDEKVKETDADIESGLKEKKKKKKKNKTKSVEAESLGHDDDDDKEKVSKKRKRSEPEETKEETEDDDEESKRRKKEETVVEDDEGVQETPVKQNEVQENKNAEKSEAKSTNQKSGKGFSNSKEPKIPFQRVKVDEVVFTDERLKDNSYWAKDGADVGYGAKAQEVLGQVRGRGFRHEKTKKKRGSYRGGEIDLQSRSVKFDYSEEE